MASMGPRALARGNGADNLAELVFEKRFNGAARSRARKWIIARPQRWKHALLQWGRALSRAEISPLTTYSIAVGLLQWGRALSRAEISLSRLDLPPHLWRFNGAARSRARK